MHTSTVSGAATTLASAPRGLWRSSCSVPDTQGTVRGYALPTELGFYVCYIVSIVRIVS